MILIIIILGPFVPGRWYWAHGSPPIRSILGSRARALCKRNSLWCLWPLKYITQFELNPKRNEHKVFFYFTTPSPQLVTVNGKNLRFLGSTCVASDPRVGIFSFLFCLLWNDVQYIAAKIAGSSSTCYLVHTTYTQPGHPSGSSGYSCLEILLQLFGWA